MRPPNTPADRLRVLALCFISFSSALSDTAINALLPAIER